MNKLLGFENDISVGDFTVADDTAFSTGSFKAQLNSLQNILIRSSPPSPTPSPQYDRVDRRNRISRLKRVSRGNQGMYNIPGSRLCVLQHVGS